VPPAQEHPRRAASRRVVPYDRVRVNRRAKPGAPAHIGEWMKGHLLTMNTNRQPAGQPTGGQFAEGARASAGVSLQNKVPIRFAPLSDPVHPSNLRVQAMLALATWRSSTGDWKEDFPE